MNHINDYNPVDIQLAYEICDRLDDSDALTQYLQFAQQYPHEKLRQLVSKVESMPDHKIINSRGALFHHLVNQYKYSQFRDGHPRN